MDLVVVSKLYATDWKDALIKLCDHAVKKGYAKPTLLDALIDREKRYPTGFPVADKRGVALPHEDVIHAIKPVIMIARPVTPIYFGRMDNSKEEVESLLIIMVIVDEVKKYLNTIDKVTPFLSDIKLVENLRNLKSAELKQEVLSYFSGKFSRCELVELY